MAPSPLKVSPAPTFFMGALVVEGFRIGFFSALYRTLAQPERPREKEGGWPSISGAVVFLVVDAAMAGTVAIVDAADRQAALLYAGFLLLLMVMAGGSEVFAEIERTINPPRTSSVQSNKSRKTATSRFKGAKTNQVVERGGIRTGGTSGNPALRWKD